MVGAADGVDTERLERACTAELPLEALGRELSDAARDADRDQRADEAAATARLTAAGKVLIVDDRPIDVALRAAVVKTVEGLEPVGFLDPAEALRWCEREAPILVLVDHAMPGTRGDDFVRRLRGVAEARPGREAGDLLRIADDWPSAAKSGGPNRVRASG